MIKWPLLFQSDRLWWTKDQASFDEFNEKGFWENKNTHVWISGGCNEGDDRPDMIHRIQHGELWTLNRTDRKK